MAIRPAFSVLGMLRVLLQMAGMNVCVYIAVLPIIALTAQRSGSFMAGVGFAFFYGFIGTFASGHGLGEIYPYTLPSYNEDGEERSITFETARELKEAAFA